MLVVGLMLVVGAMPGEKLQISLARSVVSCCSSSSRWCSCGRSRMRWGGWRWGSPFAIRLASSADLVLATVACKLCSLVLVIWRTLVCSSCVGWRKICSGGVWKLLPGAKSWRLFVGCRLRWSKGDRSHLLRRHRFSQAGVCR